MRQWVGMLLFCALLLRGMIPSGYMPDFNAAEGQGFLIICSGNAAQAVAGSDDGMAPADTHQQGLCAFAFLGAVAPVLLLIALLLWLPPRHVRYRLGLWVDNARPLICAPPGARAPPAFA
ncbi:hypothetical protein [Niveispirillum sp.]|uniref:hypothetical protein n=1 Tax=Niveispirillum sp. TaxID=1917217 RepID=UPI001B70A4D2|nr:hypothetical protein [Niveispirillum sp.]MBP7340658.1 hypothetical protein [Niveispirillum sp.]